MTPSVEVPTLLIDEKRCRANIRRMAEKAKRHGLIFRPHYKTHQSLEVAQWLREEGITKITVSSLRMAEFFAAAGWDDMTVAFPVNVLEMERINALAQQIQLQLLVASVEAVQTLAEGLHQPVSLLIEIDTGYGRTGIAYDDFAVLDTILEQIDHSDVLHFMGFLGHAGHTYTARSPAEIQAIHQDSLPIVQLLKEHYAQAYPDLIISMGDTPSCSMAEDFGKIDELRPGNLVYYDLTQVAIGSCAEADIAVAMACPVVARYPERNEIVIYGGGVHFSKDRLEMDNGQVIYGKVVASQGNSWGASIPGAVLSKISQEHGTVSLPADQLERFQIGDIVMILPVHSCMCANLMSQTDYGREMII